MNRLFTVLLAALLLAGAAAASTAADLVAADYDRYERAAPRGDYEPPPPPPPRAAYAPPPRHAMYGQPYMNIQIGMFEPNGDADGLSGYDTGSDFSLAFGSRVSPIFAFEGTFGAYGADRGDDEVRVVPLTIGARLIVPHPFFEPYLTGGVGFYFSHLKENAKPVGRGLPNFQGIDDSDATFGGYVGGGVDAWLSNRVALNFEGKYHIATAQFAETNFGTPIDVNVSGWVLNLGVRITFGGGAY